MPIINSVYPGDRSNSKGEKPMKVKENTRRLLSLTLVLIMCLSLLPTIHAKAATVINETSLTISVPAEGEDPDYLPELPAGAHYETSNSSNTITYRGVIWFDITDGIITSLRVGLDRFEVGHKYRVWIYLMPDSGYEFTSQTTCTINGKSASCELVGELGELRVSIDFPVVTGTVYNVQLAIEAPVTGKSPDYYPYLENDGGYYSAPYDEGYFQNDVIWTDLTSEDFMTVGEDVFQEGHTYQVSIYLTPKEYYAFAESVYVVVNGDNIDSYEVWNTGQLRITYTFPQLTVYIRTADIEITPPEAGEYPDYYPSFNEADGYYSDSYDTETHLNDVYWTDLNTNTPLIVGQDAFEEGHSYRAIIYLTPKEGYAFLETVNVTLNGDTVHTYGGYGNQLRIVYDFPVIPYTAGWQKDDTGWWYRWADGTYPKNRWEKIDGKWYHFDTSGYMQTGWQKISNKWYYLGTSGVMVTGWKQISGKWYYFNSSGVMQTGWQKISNKWYYFNSSGVMQTGWQTISGKTYYFKDNGAMAAKEWCKGYWLNSDGTWTYKYKASWKRNSKGWWYGDTSGWYAKNCTITIDGKSYTFDANGYMK